MKLRLVTILGVMVVAAAIVVQPAPPSRAAAKPNVVLILTDDQVMNTLQFMPSVESLLVNHGTELTNDYLNNPWCCPSRTTIMTGQTSGHNGVWAVQNSAVGGFQAFLPHAGQTIFPWLHAAGYRTGLIGKFLNGYTGTNVGWTLPGVDEWDAFLLEGANIAGCNPSGYWETCYSHNGTLEKHSSTDYSTTTSGAKAVDFIKTTPAGQPLFLYYAPRAPHLPTLPEAAHSSGCPGLPPHRPPSFGKPIVNGPSYMPTKPLTATQTTWDDHHWLADCRTLLSVDDQVGNIVQALQDTGRLVNTMIMFTSDNGFLFGEHSKMGKIVPYEESDRVPLVIRWDALGTQPATASDLVTNMDYTATILAAAGASPPTGYQVDGQSLLPLIGGAGTWRNEPAVLIEHAKSGTETRVPPYCGIRTPDWLYAEYSTGEQELYDVQADPYQMVNVAADWPAVVATLRQQTQALCTPLPPGFTWAGPARGGGR